MERLINAIDNLSQLYEEYILSETDMVNIRPYDEILQDVHSLLEKYRDTGLTPEEIEQNKEYIQILEKENKLIKEQYIKEADTVDCYKKLAQENAELKELLKLAVEDIKSLSKHFGICHHCINSSGYCNRCKLGKTVNASFCNDWQWQHADKLKTLGVE